jgi:hypothetical protein
MMRKACFKCGGKVTRGVCTRCKVVQNPAAEQCWACHCNHPKDADCETIYAIDNDEDVRLRKLETAEFDDRDPG